MQPRIRSARLKLPASVVLASAIAFVPAAAQSQTGLREAFLVASSDSIREGRYQWAAGTLGTLVTQDPSDWQASSLLAVALAGKGDVVLAREVAMSLTSRPEAEGIRAIVNAAIDGFESAGRLRAEFTAAVQAADVPAARNAIQTSGLAEPQRATASAVLCVLMGDRPCFQEITTGLGADQTSRQVMAALSLQLAAAEHEGRRYGVALAFLAGADSLLQAGDSLAVAERAAHAQCSTADKKDRDECRRGLLVRLVGTATGVVASAPLSRSALEAALITALLTETGASVDSATQRMKRALGAVEWPLWQQRRRKERSAFDLKEGADHMVLAITDNEVVLRQSAFPGPRLVPLLAKGMDEGGRGDTGVVWRIASAQFREAARLRQPIDWDDIAHDGRESLRALGRDGNAVELTLAGAKHPVPYPVGLYLFSRVYGEPATRAVLRTVGTAWASALAIPEAQVELVDSIRKTGFLKKLSTGLVTAAGVASLATGQTATGLSSLNQAAAWVAEDEAIVASRAAERAKWLQVTEESQTLQQIFDQSVRQQWVAQLLEQLPLMRGGGG